MCDAQVALLPGTVIRSRGVRSADSNIIHSTNCRLVANRLELRKRDQNFMTPIQIAVSYSLCDVHIK